MSGITIEKRNAQPTLCVRVRTTAKELPKLIEEKTADIRAYLSILGEEAKGEPYAVYLNWDKAGLDAEIGIAVGEVLPDRGEIKAGELPAYEAATSVFRGAYREMKHLYAEMNEWIDRNGYAGNGLSYEFYYNFPSQVPEEELRTRVDLPIEKK
ncbi:MAG: GyrI-like domain-containing protein [Anaerofustis sp.]